jgi:hypothetical protein
MAASIDRARSLEAAWIQRLGYQRKDLPPFEDVLKEVRRCSIRGDLPKRKLQADDPRTARHAITKTVYQRAHPRANGSLG